MNILFMGTPEFAVPCLEALIKSEHRVVGAVTQPDKPAGRGHKLTPPPVKVCAEENGVKMPSFFGYMFKFSLIVLLPVYILVQLIFL